MAEEQGLPQLLRTKFPGAILGSRGDDEVVISREAMLEVFRTLKEDPRLAFTFLVDLTAVDYWGRKEPRFEVVYHLGSFLTNRRLRVKIPVLEQDPTVESLTSLWRGADWLEREAWDMYGIRFRGHPNLKRVLLYEEFQGHPLRKNYPLNQEQPLVPLRVVQGTFVDQQSSNKLAQLRQKLAGTNF
ncbi:MAG: NADH-quinone oxidoreductase subunit C [Candidatus Binatia bacterium]